MPELLPHQHSKNLTGSVELPKTFNTLAESWADLIECHRVSALGILWEAKKQVIGPAGEKWGLNEKEFIKRTAAIIGEEREVVLAVLMKYKESQPHPEPPPLQVKYKLQKQQPKVPLGDRLKGAKKPKGNGAGRPKKEQEESKPVVPTLADIRRINEVFTQKDAERKRKRARRKTEQIRKINEGVDQTLGKTGVS